jgi:hypothetical protein
MIMTRSGVPFQGTNGEGKIENPVACSHVPGAASAGGSVVAKMNAAAAAAVNRVARRILPTLLEEPGPVLGPADLSCE